MGNAKISFKADFRLNIKRKCESRNTRPRVLFSIIFIILLWALSVEARQEIVAVQSSRIAPYEEALKGFKSVSNAVVSRLVISESGGADVVKELRARRPDIILAIGPDALSLVKRIKDLPVVYLMVLNPHTILSQEENITGVSMHIPIERQLFSLINVLPDIKTIGLLYDPDKTGHLADKARIAAAINGVVLVAGQVHNSGVVPSALMEMKEKIDVFWMLPDTTLITPETIEFMLLFSLEHNIPILAFSEKYVELGALMSIGIDAFDMGAQAGEMAAAILSGIKAHKVAQADARLAVVSINQQIARKAVISVNQKIVHKLNVPINEKIMGTTRIVKRGTINEFKFHEGLQ